MKLPSFRVFIPKNFKTPWWVEISTQIPTCTYYFGPFDSENEAKLSQAGYFSDLVQENAQGITAKVKKIRPKTLTIYDE